MEEIRLWKISADATGKRAAVAVTPTDRTKTEQLLEDLLSKSPELLLEGLQIVGRQCETETGPLDLLGVDQEGRLVVFELKRGTLTRLAVAQAVDYASYLADLTDEQLGQFISHHSGTNDVTKIPDFAAWYGERFPSTGGLGKPRIILVGVGADTSTRRMVKFLNDSGVDISIISFHAYLEGGQTFLARSVEAQSRIVTIASKNNRAGNQAELDRLLDQLKMKPQFEALANAFKATFGSPQYQWPYKNAYAFSRQGPPPTNGTYMTLNADVGKPRRARIYLQPRAVSAASLARIKDIATDMGGSVTQTPGGYVYFSFDVTKPEQTSHIARLGEAIASGLTAEITGGEAPNADEQSEAQDGE